MTAVESPADVYISLFRDAQATQWVSVSAVCFVVYDVLINLGDEIELIWGVPWTWVNWAYLYIRHFGMLSLASLLFLSTNDHNKHGFSHAVCRGFIVYECFLTLSLIFVVECVLMIRIYAIFGQNRRLLRVLSLFLACETVVAAVGQGYTSARTVFDLQLGCVATLAPTLFIASWIAPLSFQTVLFALTMWKFLGTIMRKTPKDTVVFMLLRDGIWAYALMFGVLLLNMLMFQLKNSPLAPLCFKWALSIISFCGSHVLLNMRRLHARVNTFTESTSHITLPQEDFAMTTYTAYQFNGSTDSIRHHSVDDAILPTHIKDTMRATDNSSHR
ncbi:hypothetical protein QCA50_006996 [Cerrena zonata]|uniref:DUF6533 domain-containing protein n=1 Tax=Cerrena zonata TaxID=2478898 RepID=A0AAW0GL33_9APHY